MSYRILTLLTILVSIPAFSASERHRSAVYFGGSAADVANAVAVDGEGNAYVAGSMTREAGKKSAFVSKTKADGTEVLWTAYLDGASAESIAVDSRGAVWAGGAGFLAKLNGEDGRVERSLEVAGVRAVAVDQGGAVYAAGDGFVTKYAGFEVVYTAKVAGMVQGLAVDGNGAAYAAFGNSVGRLTADGGMFDYTLDLGFAANAVAIDGLGAAYVTGKNAMVAKVSPAGDGLVYAVSLGGVLEQEGRSIALDGMGNLYVTGWTNSSDFALARGWHGDRDGFLVVLNGAGEVMATEFAGTAARDAMNGVAVTAAGDIYLAGFTEAAGLGDGPLAQLQGGTDAVLVKFAANGTNRAITGTTTTLATNPAGAAGFGQPVVLTATVSPAGATGKVTFYDGLTVIGTATLSGTTATLTTKQLAAGSRSLRAYYLGDVNFSASTSANLTLVVSVTPALGFATAGGATVSISGQPISVSTGDFNGDGRLDVAVPNVADNNVTVLLGNGTGGFSAASGSPIAVGVNPFSIGVGDFNGDGKADMAVTNFGADTISILLGNGNGTFTAAAAVPMLGSPVTVRVTDVNLDGNADLVTANFNGQTLGVMLGNGAGGFTAGSGNQTAIGGVAGSIAIGDFNKDGKVDVAVTNYSLNKLSIFLGNGTGGFTVSGSPYSTGLTPSGLDIADFNGDGNLDVVTANFSDTTLSLFLGNGTGGFTAAPSSPLTVGSSPRAVVAFDYDGDGKMDLASANAGSDSVSVLKGNGLGGFTSVTGSPFAVGSIPMWITAADFTGDGRVDLAVANRFGGMQTVPGVGAAPLVAGMVPASPTTATQTLNVTLRDGDGYGNFARVYFLINTSATIPQNSCHGFYDRGENNFYLYNDALTVLQGPLAAGSAGTLQNSQCILYGTGSGVSAEAGTDTSLNMRMTMQGLYATTTEKVYFWALDKQNLGTGWVQTGSWVLGAPVGSPAPTVVSGTPTNPTTSPQTFTFTVRDNNGSANLDRVYFLVNTTATTPVNSCHGFYDRATNGLYLYNNDYSVLQGPLTLGTSGSLSNSQCSVNGLTSSLVSGAGTDVVFNLGMSLLGSYATSSQNIYIWAVDKEANGTGWVQTGTWGNQGNPVAPTFVSGTPSNPAGSPQTFALVARDGNGYSDISRMYFVVNTSATVPANSCHGFYDRATGAFYLYNDALTVLQGPLTPGVAGSLANSQCSINGALSTVSGSGTDLTVTLTMSLLGSYGAGQQKLFTWTVDNAGTGTGWQLASTWNGSTAPSAPTLPVVSPTSSASATQTFSLTGRDANGFSDINRFYFQVHTSATVPANTCHGFYDRASNSIFLYNDALTALTSFTVGTAGSVQNSQCRINGAATTVTGAGTDVVLNLNITRQGTYTTGAKSLLVWVIDNGGLGTGWLTAANWTL